MLQVRTKNPGDNVTVKINRDGQDQEVTVTLAQAANTTEEQQQQQQQQPQEQQPKEQEQQQQPQQQQPQPKDQLSGNSEQILKAMQAQENKTRKDNEKTENANGLVNPKPW